MRPIRLHDTHAGALAPLVPRDPGPAARIGIYACGPTVYNRIHIGNARPYVVFSLLKRFLAHEGYGVTLVINITDVNDKIYDAARARDVPSQDLADTMAAHYVADTDRLDLGRPDHEPLASASIDAIVDLIAALVERGAAYAVEGDVYFRVRADEEYGTLSHRRIEDMDQGEGGAGLSRKEDPLDFALWKAQKDGEDTAWDAPWGRGRPGWHIECSAMAESILGVDFEIHGGGNDLTFPHHENEAAQTRCGRDAPLARIWMHNGMLQLGGEKMAKSEGNIALLPEVLDAHGRDTVIMFFCGGHYRGPLQLDDSSLADAAARVRRIREAGRGLEPGPSAPWSAELRATFFAALADDFNTPRALAAVADWVRAANTADVPVGDADLRAMLGVLGLANLLDDEAGAASPAVVALADARQAARAVRDFARSDALRDEIAAAGWSVRDVSDGYELVRA